MADLFIAADDRVEFAFARHLHEVAAVFGQRFIVVFGVRAGDLLVAAHLFERCKKAVLRDAELLEQLCGRCAAFIQQGKVQMLHADVFVLETVRDLFCFHQQFAETGRGVHGIAAALHFRQFVQFFLDRACECGGVFAHVADQFWDEAVLLLQKRQMQVFAVDLLVAQRDGVVLRLLDSLLRFHSEFVDVHTCLVPPC